MKFKILSLIIICFLAANLNAQAKWQRQEAVEPPLQLFASSEVYHLPTAETMQAGDVYFSISHVFTTPVTSGISQLFGFDGSVLMRLALGYAITDDILLKLGRSNLDGNLDLKVKYKAIQINSDYLPVLIAVEAGAAYNTEAKPVPGDNARLWQYFGHIIINTLIDQKLGIGLVPSAVINSDIHRPETINSFTMGAYVQYYLNKKLSFFIEANPTINGLRNYYDTYTLGVELNTGGHFFKIIAGNNFYNNTSQYLSGAKDDFGKGKLHIGFLITRYF